MGAELLHADRQTDKLIDTTTLVVAFRNFENLPKYGIVYTIKKRGSKLKIRRHRKRWWRKRRRRRPYPQVISVCEDKTAGIWRCGVFKSCVACIWLLRSKYKGLIRTEFFRVVAADPLAPCRPAGSYESFEELCCILPQCANYLIYYPHTRPQFRVVQHFLNWIACIDLKISFPVPPVFSL